MRWIPRTLLGRNLLLFGTLIAFALGTTGTVFFRLVAVPRNQATIAYAIQLAEALARHSTTGSRDDTTGAAGAGPARVLAPGEAPPTFQRPARRATENALREIGARLPHGYELGWQEDGAHLWIGVPANGVDSPGAQPMTWVSFPTLDMLPRMRGVAVSWLLAIGLLAFAGAFIAQRRVDRPLRELVGAAEAIGAGRAAPVLAERGPAEIAQLARAFNAMARDLEALDRERAVMLAGISHDLRTPLSKILLALEMIGPAADPQLRSSIERSVESANRVIDQFVDFGRGGGDELPVPTDLNALARALIAERANDGVHLEPGSVPTLALRPLAMHRLLANLVDNALKYAGAPVTVRTRATPDGRGATLSVVDLGPGIPADDAARLMRPFARASRARADVPGAGLGLAIVERIATAHGARVELVAAHPGAERAGLEARVTFGAASLRRDPDSIA